MRNKSEEIYKSYFKKLTLVKMAYPKYHRIFTFILIISFIIITPFIIRMTSKVNEYIIGFLILFLYFCGFMGIIEYSRLRVVRKYNDRKMRYNYQSTFNTFYDIRVNLFKQIIIDEKLYNIEGIKYLIDIYMKKSEKHKFREFAIFAIVLATIAQEFIDIILFRNTEKLSKSVFNLKYLEANYEVIIPIVFILFYIYFIYRFFAYEILNNKSNNYKILANLLEETFLSELISDLSSDNSKQKYVITSSYSKQPCNKCRKYIPRINLEKRIEENC